MIPNLHSLLKRQLKKHGYGGVYPPEWEVFLNAVNDAYHQFDNDRTMVEHSLELSSLELFESNQEMKKMFNDLKVAHEELKNTQHKLLQSEKMASIGQLSAGVAHEINNPLSFIMNNNDILNQYIDVYNKLFESCNALVDALERHDAAEAEKIKTEIGQFCRDNNFEHIKQDVKNLLSETKDGIERIRHIVSDLKAFSREDKNVMAPVDINNTVEGALKIVKNEIKYYVEIKKDLGEIPRIIGNEKRLGQVFLNLFLNAAQAIDDKGELSIKTTRDNGVINIAIKDTGRGIREEDLPRIFDPFYTTKPVGEGTGLGLSICYDIIKGHGGEISVVSEPGKGSTFTVSLPVKSDHASNKKPEK